MPFRFCNAPSTFQATMNTILWPHLRKFVLAFFNDILVYSTSKKEHRRHLVIVLELLEENQFYIKLTKYKFWEEELEYLGHIILLGL